MKTNSASIICTALLGLTFQLTPAPAADAIAPAKIYASLEQRIESAMYTCDTAALTATVTELDAARAAAPADPSLIYLRGFAHYAAGVQTYKTNDKAALERELDAAADMLETVRGEPWETEASALRGTILGNLIASKGPMSGMILGPRSSSLIKHAIKVVPGNPRFQFFRAISLANTPEAFGGDPVEARRLFELSAASFEKSNSFPAWGHANALAWLGQSRKRAGDIDGARQAYDAALAIAPEYGWIKYALLPSLESPAITPAKHE